jgi:hypothetical protein
MAYIIERVNQDTITLLDSGSTQSRNQLANEYTGLTIGEESRSIMHINVDLVEYLR